MDEKRLRQFDMTLLLIFSATMRYRKYTTVAQRLGLTQPAISHAMKRLRNIFDDELFLRKHTGVEPTARAIAIEPQITAIIETLNGTLASATGFNPLSEQRTLRLGTCNYEASVLGSAIGAFLQAEAPGIRLWMTDILNEDIIGNVKDDNLDVGIGYFKDVPDHILKEDLYVESGVVIARKGHPNAKTRITREGYVRAMHVALSSSQRLQESIEGALSEQGVERKIAVRMPQALPIFETVATTDLLGSVPRRLAARFAGKFDLNIFEPPVDFPAFNVSVVFHKRNAHDPCIRWFCTRLKAAVIESNGAGAHRKRGGKKERISTR